MKQQTKKKQLSVNLPIDLLEKVRELSKQHGVNEYDRTSQNQMFSILIGLGIDSYERIRKGEKL